MCDCDCDCVCVCVFACACACVCVKILGRIIIMHAVVVDTSSTTTSSTSSDTDSTDQRVESTRHLTDIMSTVSVRPYLQNTLSTAALSFLWSCWKHKLYNYNQVKKQDDC